MEKREIRDFVSEFTYLEAKFRLEKTIQRLAIGASIRIVDPLIRAHDVSATGSYSVLERPVEDGQLVFGFRWASRMWQCLP